MSDLTRADLEVLVSRMVNLRQFDPTSPLLGPLARMLDWASKANAALRFIGEMEDTSICECEGCSCDIGAMAEEARAARLPEEKP